MIEVMVSFILTANVCLITTDSSPVECKNYMLGISTRNVCESRKASMLQNVLWTKAEDYGWPKGTKFSVVLECNEWTQRLGA